jgi:poly(A) polymerase
VYSEKMSIFNKTKAMADFSWVHQDMYQKLFACLPDPTCMRFVGGVVRNTFLNLPFDDVDFATSYRPEEMTAFFNQHGCKVIPTGIEHGTVTVLSHGNAYEITTLRRDIETDGRHAIIAYTPMWEEDAQRRDFTMNAMYVDHCGTVHDYVGGQNDVHQGLIRFIGDPERRITEDYLRILRFFRFWALYGRHADPDGLEVCFRMKDHLAQLSSERITKEMLKLLGAKDPWPILSIMNSGGLYPLVWGNQGRPHGISALQILENLWGPADLWVRLAMVTGCMPQRLTLSRSQKKHLQDLWTELDETELWASVYTVGLPVTQERMWMKALLGLVEWSKPSSLAEVDGSQRVHETEALPNAMIQWLESRKKEIQELGQQIFPDFPLSGRDVMSLGISGPEIGRVLQGTKAWWIQCKGRPTHEECLEYAGKIPGNPAL